jgi:hypothetical protein
MSRCTWPPSLRQRTFSILMVIIVSTGYRRWLCRPWQWSLRDYMVIVAVSAAGLVLSGFPTIIIIFFTTGAAAIYICLSLARHGFRLADIATLLAIILVTAAFMLPALEQTRSRALGKRFYQSLIPARYMTLLSDSKSDDVFYHSATVMGP